MNFFRDSGENVRKMFNCKKLEMVPLIKEEDKIISEKKICHLCKKEFGNNDDDDDKNPQNVRDHFHYTGKDRGIAHIICNLT